jgi:hypothetical protein
MKIYQKGLIQIIIPLVIFVIGILAIILFSYKNGKIKIPTILVSPTPIETADNLSNWKNYSNSNYHYEIKYPFSWSFSEYPTAVTFDTKIQSPDKNSNYFLTIMQESKANFDQFEESSATSQVGTEIINETTFTTYKSFDLYFSLNYLTRHNSKFIRIMIYPYEENAYSKDIKETIDLMLSSFKFTDQVITPTLTTKAKLLSLSGWKSASALTFSLKYPDGLTPFIPTLHDQISLFNGDKAEGLPKFSVSRVGDPKSSKPNTLYSGGSRREWWIRSQYDSDHKQPSNLFFVEKTIGNISGLEIFEGNNLIGILVAHNSNLYLFDRDEDLSTLETIVSTLTFK